MATSLSLSQARRIALGAQGLAHGRPTGPVTARQVGRTLDRIHLVQIDSVNVLIRSHYLPLFSRLGPYDRGILERFSGKAPRRVVEYWAHEASFVLPPLLPDLRAWQRRTWMGAHAMDPVLRDQLSARVLDCLATSRPLTAREVASRIGHAENSVGDEWGWNWSAVKRVLEHLFSAGVISAASRTGQFERRYAMMEKVAGSAATAEPVDPQEALRRLVTAAARSLGIGTVKCFADYFRTPIRDSADAVAHLVSNHVLEPVQVQGWDRSVYRHVDAHMPRRADGRALLSPFDSMVFERSRLEELFGFRYRLEIYTPAERRQYGYYVLPFLLGEAMVARVDLKADRKLSALIVRGAFAEPGAPASTAPELSAELRLMAAWLGLGRIIVEPRGDLAGKLAGELAGELGAQLEGASDSQLDIQLDRDPSGQDGNQNETRDVSHVD